MTSHVRTLVAVAIVVILASVLAGSVLRPSMAASPAVALPCPGSLNLLGLLTVNVDCVISTNTVWGNGTLALSGNLTVTGGAALRLYNVTLQFSPNPSEASAITLDDGQLLVRGGTLTSTDSSYPWHLQTTTAAGALVDLEGTNVSNAGSATTSAFLLQSGTGDRFDRVAVSASAVGSSGTTGVIRIVGPSVDNLQVENSTFTGSGCALSVDRTARGTHLVFSHNQVTNFEGDPSSEAVFGGNTQVTDNVLSLGSAMAIEVWGGGPGWPAANAYAVSGNTITTTGNAIMTYKSNGYDILDNTVIGGHIVLDGTGNRFAYNNVSGTDERVTPAQHVLWTSPNSSIDHNSFWNIGLTQDSVILTYKNYGNVRIADNRLFAGCYGSNCMAIETINVQSAQTTVYPGFPTVEVARNHITWTAIASDGLTIMLDNEFSEREWLHDNVETVADPNGRATSSLQAGGVTDSVYENNTILGPTTFCIYEYIYSDAGNLFENNRCNNAAYGGIFQTGGNTYRNNTFTNLTTAGIWICPNAPCAGSDSLTTSNAWYNNTFAYASSLEGYLTKMSLSNALTNSFVGHGRAQWTDGVNVFPVYGDWLFFANATITHLAFADSPGARAFSMVAGDRTFWDREAVSSVADRAQLSLDGFLSPYGSLDEATVLWSLDPNGSTDLYVMGQGTLTLTLAGFLPGHTYAVILQDRATGDQQTSSLLTDGTGGAVLPVDLGTTPTQDSVLIEANNPAPPGDRTAPAAVTDLRAVTTGSNAVGLQWTTPGNDGMVGQAAQYDLRYSTSGPITNASFNESTPVALPAPGLPGSTTSFTIQGLSPGTEYWFALRTADAVPNWSPLSNVVSVTTLPPGSGSSSFLPPTPSVLSAVFGGASSSIDLVFSEPMDRASVNTSIRITPQLDYRVTWLNDTHVRLTFSEPLSPWTTYVLTVTSMALDASGNPMAGGFTFKFSGSGPGSAPSPWFRIPEAWSGLGVVPLASALLIALLGSLGTIGAERLERRMDAEGRGEGPASDGPREEEKGAASSGPRAARPRNASQGKRPAAARRRPG